MLARTVKNMQPQLSKRFKSRRAVSAVISNMILLAAVIAAGFAALAWTLSTSNTYQTQYGKSTSSSINQLMESVAFEFSFYNRTSKNLTAYVMNCGKIANVSLAAAYISNQTMAVVYSKTNGVQLYFLNKTSALGLNIGDQGYFVLSLPQPLQYGTGYLIQIQTGRGSYFEGTFTA